MNQDDFLRGYQSARRHYEGDPTSALLRIRESLSVLRQRIPSTPPAGNPITAFLDDIETALRLGLHDADPVSLSDRVS